MGRGTWEESSRVEATTPPRVTSTDSLGGAPGAGECAVFFDGVDGVLGTGGEVAAVAAEETAEGGAIEEDEMDEQPAHFLFCQLE